ncbi:MAG: hypothetical protein IKI75_03990 [Lachnospiraceae bacterium]|nr:hypothetical protein [Lachnospiraceae bacterium]
MYKNIRASMTLEASIVLPLFLFFFMVLLSVMDMLALSMKVDTLLSGAGRETALYIEAKTLTEKPAETESAEAADKNRGGSGNSSGLGSVAMTVLADGYAASKISRALPPELLKKYRVQGGISLLLSKVMAGNDQVDLVAAYSVKPAGDIFGLGSRLLLSRARCHAWNGYGTGGSYNADGEQLVYITESGTVYHMSRSCYHLRVTINPISRSLLEDTRNASGSRYKACEYCGLAGSAGTLFITPDGDRYHTSLNCSGLKRTVYEIPISQAGSKKACKSCGGNF